MMTAELQSAPAIPQEQSKTAQFRKLLTQQNLNFAMEAHNGLAAKIVEETGFSAIWASGLTMSASLGVRDNNEASWTQVLETLEFMSDATSIPILVDGDTGYGNFNNFRRLVRKLCERQVAAVCIEDKLFPKTNSFIGEAQPLADIEEFSGKIKAGKDSQPDDDFSVIARVEALIAGWPMDEALRRAEAYHQAGADGILIHSKQAKPDEIMTFAREWGNRCPLVIVPTMYYATPTQWFRDAKIAMVIWANHNLRAAMTAMQQVSRRIYEEQSLVNIEGEIASVRDIFDITGNAELRQAEERYLSRKNNTTQAIILAASRGHALQSLTVDKPKCMIEIQGQPLLRRLVKSFSDCGIDNVTVVRGYCKEAINLPAIKTVDNDDYETTGEAASLYRARAGLEGDCIVSFGDVLFRKYILDLLMETDGDIVLAIDGRWAKPPTNGDAGSPASDLVRCSAPYTGNFLEDDMVTVEKLGQDVTPVEAHGRWIGVLRLSSHGSELVRETLDEFSKEGTLDQADTLQVLERLRGKGQKIRAVYIAGHWLDVNETVDVISAGRFVSPSE